MKTLRQMMDLIENFQQVPEGSEQKKPLKTHKSGCGYNHGHDCDCSGTLTHASNCHYNYGHDCDCGLDELKHQQQNKQQGVAEGMSRDEYNQIQYAIDNFKDEYGEEPSGPDIFNIADSLGVEPDAVINVLYGRIVPEQGVAEHQMEESTPDALAKIDNLFRK